MASLATTNGLSFRSGTTQKIRASTSLTVRPQPCRRVFTVRASADADPDADLDKRIEKLRQAKGATPYGQGVKAGGSKPSEPSQASSEAKSKKSVVTYDYTGETLYYEGSCHPADLAVNLALGATLVCLPLTAAAIGRAAFVKYRFTDKRFSVTTAAPWKNDQLDVAYQEIKDVVTVGRALGLYGDMVVTLRDNSKVELRSLDRFLELKQYILKKRDELTPTDGILTANELMGESDGKKKGFA